MKCNKHFTNVCDTWVKFMPSSCLNLSLKFYVCPLLLIGEDVCVLISLVFRLRSAGESSTRRLRAAEPPLTWPKSCDLCVNRPIMRGWREGGEVRLTALDQWESRTDTRPSLASADQGRGAQLWLTLHQDMLESRRITLISHLVEFLNKKPETLDWLSVERNNTREAPLFSVEYWISAVWRPKERWRIFFIKISFIRRNFVGAGGDLTTFVVQNTKNQKIKLKIQNLHQHWSKSLKISTTNSRKTRSN